MSRDAIRGGPVCPHNPAHGTTYPMDGTYYYCSHSDHTSSDGGGPSLWDKNTMEPMRYRAKDREATERAAREPKATKVSVTYAEATEPSVASPAPAVSWTPKPIGKRGRPKGHPGNRKLAEMGLTFDQYRAKMGL